MEYVQPPIEEKPSRRAALIFIFLLLFDEWFANDNKHQMNLLPVWVRMVMLMLIEHIIIKI